MKNVIEVFKQLISAIYPNKCICCGELIGEGISICGCCSEKIERTNLDNFCLDCGFEKDDCTCKYNVFRFCGQVAAFKNAGLAQKAYYSYKFGKKQHYVGFFAEEMCRVIGKCYQDVNFDIVCAVPMFSKREYDHSGYIAKAISQKLDLPFCDGLLSCVKKGKKQHKSTISERLKNVDGKYFANYRIDKKTVLLIDDIKTTGATLDECARILLFAGADRVFCATALGGTVPQKLN